MTIVQAPFFQNQPTGQIIYTEVGTYTFTVPDDVFFLGAVCVGGGGGGARDNNNAETGGGGGGGLRFTQYLPVNPGEILTIVVGSGGPGATANGSGTAGGNTTISRGGTTLLQANGGGAGTQTVGGTGGTGTTIEGIIGGGDGGNGGNESADFDGGGGGAGGYSGNGGAGGVNVTNGGTGTGGGGGGGGSGGTGGGGGGGVNLFGGDGTLNGSGGNSGIVGNIGGVGNGGSGGSSGSGLVGGLYGGGGGGNDGASGGNGADGAARIIWGPNRSFPNNRTTDIFTGSILSYDVSFASSNATTNGSITVPSIANGDLYLFIVYENDTVNRPTITGFNIILSDNGTFDGAACTRVLLKGKATPGSTITIPNDATFNGFSAALIGFSDETNLGQTIFQAGVANVSFSSITNGYFVMLANHDGLTESYDTYNLDADFTRTFTYLTANGAVTGRAAAIGVVEPIVQSGTITPSRPAVGATVQTQGTQFCFLYID